jgi:hypothetical protein
MKREKIVQKSSQNDCISIISLLGFAEDSSESLPVGKEFVMFCLKSL